MVKLTRKYKKKNSRTKSMKKHKVSKKSRKSGKQWKKGGMKNTFAPSKNSAFRPITQQVDIESGINNNPKPIVSSFSLDEFDLESGTPIPPSFSRTNTPNVSNILNLSYELLPHPSPYSQPSIFIPGEKEKEDILYEKKKYNDYLQKYSPDPNIEHLLNYEDYIKEILIPDEGIKYVKYGIQLYTLPNTNRVYDKNGKLFTEQDIQNLKKKYDKTPFIDPDDLIVDNDKLGIYKNKNDPPGSKNIYDKEGYLLDKAGLDALLHNYALKIKERIKKTTSK